MGKYRLLKDSRNEKTAKAGTIVYDIKWFDAGMASSDTRASGIRHKSVTLNKDGDYPFFTVPVSDLEEIE